MRAPVVGLEHELALRADHPHPGPRLEAPEQRREADDGDQADVELVALGARDGRRRRHRIRPLPELLVGEDPDRHVLPRLEGDRLVVEPDPDGGQVLRVVDPLHQGGVVLGGVSGDDAGVLGVVGHGGWDLLPAAARAGALPSRV